MTSVVFEPDNENPDILKLGVKYANGDVKYIDDDETVERDWEDLMTFPEKITNLSKYITLFRNFKRGISGKFLSLTLSQSISTILLYNEYSLEPDYLDIEEWIRQYPYKVSEEYLYEKLSTIEYIKTVLETELNSYDGKFLEIYIRLKFSQYSNSEKDFYLFLADNYNYCLEVLKKSIF